MATDQGQGPASPADGEALRAGQCTQPTTTNGHGHPDGEGRPRAGPRTGTEAAREWALRCRGLAEWLAQREFRRCGMSVPVDELLGEARLALVEAAGRYDEGKDVPLRAYVALIVKQRLGRAVQHWHRWRRGHRGSLSDASGPDAAPLEPPDPRQAAPDRCAAARELLERVRRSMPEQWFAVLWKNFVEGYTLVEIGEQMGVTRQWVQQLIARAVKRARRHCPGEKAGW